MRPRHARVRRRPVTALAGALEKAFKQEIRHDGGWCQEYDLLQE
jgi:hypothetical protein